MRKEIGLRCPSCGYERKLDEIAPEWQCPACQVVYAKVSQNNVDQRTSQVAAIIPSDTSLHSVGKSIPFRSIFTVVLFGLILYYGYSFFSDVTITTESSGNMVEVSPIIAPDKTVLLYSRTGCGYCDKAKLFLQKHNVAFEEIDVNTSERGKEDFQKLGES